jgi:hypothetical protein
MNPRKVTYYLCGNLLWSGVESFSTVAARRMSFFRVPVHVS